MKLEKIQNVKYSYKNGDGFVQYDIYNPTPKIDRPRIRRFQDHKLKYVVFFDNSGWGTVGGDFDRPFSEIVLEFKRMFAYAHTYK